DLATMAPARLPATFLDAYGAAAGGRTVSSRRWLGGPPDGARPVPWPLRATDVDLLGHVNNAAYWAAVEEELAAGEGGHPLLARPHRAVMEYGAAIEPDAAVELRVASAADAVSVWFTVAGAVHAAATVVALPPAAALSPG
ncbi:MAG TPA: hypothetical protein VF743_10765, partial [Acidimicrobiales bacterium]